MSIYEMIRIGGAEPVARRPVGLACSRLNPNSAEDRYALAAALDEGCDLVEVADFAAAGRTEAMVGAEVKGRPAAPALMVRFGVLCDPMGRQVGVDLRPRAVKTWLGYSLARLGGAQIDLYVPAAPDPRVPIEDTAGAVGEMIDAGFAGAFGLANAGAATIRRAHTVRQVAAVAIDARVMGLQAAEAARRQADAIGALVVETGGVSSLSDAPGRRIRRLLDPRAYLAEARETALA